jgi:hypothetical protein
VPVFAILDDLGILWFHLDHRLEIVGDIGDSSFDLSLSLSSCELLDPKFRRIDVGFRWFEFFLNHDLELVDGNLAGGTRLAAVFEHVLWVVFTLDSSSSNIAILATAIGMAIGMAME